MKVPATSLRLLLALLAVLPMLAGFGCTRDSSMNSTAGRRRIPLAPVGVASPGIGAPGAGSMDTRGTGTIATGQGDTPLEDASNGSVPVSPAGTTPGAVPGARDGGRNGTRL